ncbi:MAG: tetratricopeptide repeat protein [Acidobacteria bacterium]|nr:tetratricopeptide repeat protein [Acidobacteriota bacterium]
MVLRKLVLIIVFVAGLFFVKEIQGQTRYIGDPVKKENLVKVLKSKKYRDTDIVEIIQENGVDFKVTDSIEKELIGAGARPAVVIAARKNYRGSIKSTVGKASNVNNYQIALDKAIRQFDEEKDYDASIKTLQAAIALNPSKPRAYQLMGFAYLYGKQDFVRAEKYMRESLSRGGSAVFRVKHGHDITFSYSCSGSLYINNSGVKYEDDENEHTFDVKKSSITNVKMLGGWGKLIRRKGGAFKISIRDQKDGGDKDIYNFSPLTEKKEEAKLIIKLIGK